MRRRRITTKLRPVSWQNSVRGYCAKARCDVQPDHRSRVDLWGRALVALPLKSGDHGERLRWPRQSPRPGQEPTTEDAQAVTAWWCVRVLLCAAVNFATRRSWAEPRGWPRKSPSAARMRSMCARRAGRCGTDLVQKVFIRAPARVGGVLWAAPASRTTVRSRAGALLFSVAGAVQASQGSDAQGQRDCRLRR